MVLLEDVVATTLELAAIAAPTGAEEERAVAVAARFAAAGLPVERDAAGNVLAHVTAKRGLTPTGGDRGPVVLSAHLDTVFGPEVPLDPRRDGDRVLGPGVGDDTVAVAALIHLGAALAADPPPAPLVLAATVGEEGLGDLCGAKHLLATLPCSAFVAVEGLLQGELVVGGIGSVRLHATYTGPGGHSWGDRGTPSALHAMLAAGAAAVAAVPGGRHVNVGTAGGGTAVNAIAERAELVVDLRDVDPGRLADTAERVTAALRSRAPTPAGPSAAQVAVAVGIEVVGDRPAGALPDGHPLLANVRALIARAGLPAAAETHSSTEANAAYARGVPSVCVGLTTGGDVHRPTEWLDLPPLPQGLRLLELIARARRVTGPVRGTRAPRDGASRASLGRGGAPRRHQLRARPREDVLGGLRRRADLGDPEDDVDALVHRA